MRPSHMFGAIALASALAAFAPASAAVYQYTDSAAPGMTLGGGNREYLESLTLTFDTVTDAFHAVFTTVSDGGLPLGAWMVVNDGANPKGNPNQFGIVYLDFLSEELTVYRYNGLNSENSFMVEPLLPVGPYTMDTVDAGGKRTVSFSFDATGINTSPLLTPQPGECTGVCFGANMGLWFHISQNAPEIDAQGEVDSYRVGGQNWYDIAKRRTTLVPEPATWSLMIFAFAALGFVARRRVAVA